MSRSYRSWCQFEARFFVLLEQALQYKCQYPWVQINASVKIILILALSIHSPLTFYSSTKLDYLLHLKAPYFLMTSIRQCSRNTLSRCASMLLIRHPTILLDCFVRYPVFESPAPHPNVALWDCDTLIGSLSFLLQLIFMPEVVARWLQHYSHKLRHVVSHITMLGSNLLSFISTKYLNIFTHDWVHKERIHVFPNSTKRCRPD